MSGMVKVPVAYTLAAALPDTLPNRAEPKMAALAGPPLARRVIRQASSRNTLAMLVLSRMAPNRMNRKMMLDDAPMEEPHMPSFSR